MFSDPIVLDGVNVDLTDSGSNSVLALTDSTDDSRTYGLHVSSTVNGVPGMMFVSLVLGYYPQKKSTRVRYAANLTRRFTPADQTIPSSEVRLTNSFTFDTQDGIAKDLLVPSLQVMASFTRYLLADPDAANLGRAMIGEH